METVLVFIMLCGQIDTVVLKKPDQDQIQARASKSVLLDVKKMLESDKKPIVIIYKDDRLQCI